MPMKAVPQADARALEAAGIDSVSFDFRDVTVTIPRALEAWPLDAVRANKTGRAVRELLGDQFGSVPLKSRGDVLELSHRMADACGITPLPEEKAAPGAAFGAIPTLLDIVDNRADDLEAALLRFYRVDYRAAPPQGPTLRQVWVYVRRLPAFGEPFWTRGEVIAAQQWEMWSQQPYAGRPITRSEWNKWQAAQQANDATMDHLAARQAYYASGQNMRDAGVEPGPRNNTPQPSPQRQHSTPAGHALAVARKNAARTPGKATTDGRAHGKPAAATRYNPGDSGWG